MGDLEQQLRELSKDRFESFVHQYLVSKYPGADIKRVEGSGGDAGVDSFQGLLSSGAAIWQGKHFPNRIGPKQKEQIRQSIETAFKTIAPSTWTLCVPINLRTPEHNWFQTAVVNAYGGPGRIALIQASDFLAELLHNRRLRDAFFPDDALSKMLELRKIATLTESRSKEQMGQLVVEYAQQYLESSMDVEPRLTAIVTVGGSPQMRLATRPAGLIMSLSEGEKTTHVFARDPKTFNLDPIKFSIQMTAEHRAALEEAVDTGQSFTLPAGNILHLNTSSPLLNSLFKESEIAQLQMEILPHLPDEIAAKEIPLRLIAGSGNSAKELRYIPFQVTRAGKREIALSSRSRLPLEINLILRLSAEVTATVNLRPTLPGADVQPLHQIMQFIDELERSGEFEIASVETDAPILKEIGAKFTSNTDISEEMNGIIADASLISRTFGKTLRLPEQVSKIEAVDLHTLRLIASGEEFFDVDIDAVLTKDELLGNQVLDYLDQSELSIRIDHLAGWRNFQIFGEFIEPGPVRLVADRASFLDVDEIRNAYLTAQAGEGVPLRAHCGGPCRWILMQEVWDARAAVLSDGGARLS
jgi:hypothetical protein